MLGNQISASFEYVTKVGQEVDNLSTLVTEEINRMLSEPDLARLFASEHWSNDTRNSDNQWVSTDVIYDIPLIIKPKRSASMYLGFQISLAGDGIATGGNRLPLIHVFCWAYGPAEFPGCAMIFPLEPGEQLLDSGLLFVFEDRPGAPRSWAYSVELAQVNTLDDVARLILQPMRKLLLGAEALEAFKGDLKGLVRYEEIADQPGYYTVNILEY
ncbi:hypothetical protein [Stutzerimonas kunmingensis]|jgi:hypothetical protein|uniref:hypothetical protein n=1 Tax=Stutzerimonas kunmingensis TaxID=1211807 RepID=UPI0028ADD365|nr:hypothetical protein [Stutzerimonas kunmingensis]